MDIRRPGVTILLVAVLGSAKVYAQGPSLPAAAPATMAAAGKAEPSAVDTDARKVRLLVGRSTIVNTGGPIARVSLTSADVADALVTAPHELLVNGKTPGTISLFVWDRAGAIRRYEVTVQRDLARLTEQITQLLPGEAIVAESNGRNLVLSGKVSNKDIIEKAINLAAGYVDKKEEIVSLLQIRDGAPSNQVLLRVRFAEVARSAVTELGVSWFTSPTGIENTIARVTTQQFPSTGFSDLEIQKADSSFGGDVVSASGKFTFSDFLNLFVFNSKYDLGAMVKALQSRGLFQSLAEPNLVAESGKEASFLAGGEFPIPIAQGGGANGIAISVQYKEYGIRLNFTPVVTGDRVHLKVRPEVSTLDFANAVTLNGFQIPALATRRTETELELRSGQTFAIAGLMNNAVNQTLQKIPGIGDIPILGALFKSKAAQKNQTELVVMITPEILPNNSSGVTSELPAPVEPYLPPPPTRKTPIEQPPPAFQPAPGPQTGALTPAGPLAGTTPVGTTTLDAQSAADTVSALTPATRKVVNGDAVKPESAAPAAASTPAVSEADRKAFERAEKEERKRLEAEASAREEAERQAAKEAEAEAARQAEADRRRLEAERRQAEIERKLQEKLAREEAKRQEAERKRQEQLARIEAERQAEEEKRQAEIARIEAEREAAEQKRLEEIAKSEAELRNR
jgi:pilus assembly protein CpaC